MNDVEITYDGHVYRLNKGETVLEGLEREGVPVPSSCRAGACQFCMLKAVEGNVPANSQQGLKPQLKASGHFLACVCRPEGSLKCLPAHTADFRGMVCIHEVRKIGKDVALVRFQKPEDFAFAAGQFVTLTMADRVSRSYSIASQGISDGFFDIHVRRIDRGLMSTWFHDEAKPGDSLWMEGPKGECTYYPGNSEEPLTLIGTGTGIAPLYAIMKDALSHHHKGPIVLYQGAVSADNLYFEAELSDLTSKYANVSYVKCALQKSNRDDVTYGDLKDIATAKLSGPSAGRIYLCGDPGLVRILKKTFFLAGVSIKKIHADPFIVSQRKS